MTTSKKKSQTKFLPKAKSRTVPQSGPGALVVVIVGPTASGKTSLGINLAKKFNGEVISADSRQIYRGLDIGTAKASKADQRIIPHHLADIRNPNQSYTFADYKRDCVKTIKNILTRNKLPVIVGGTGLYIKAVVDNLTIPRVKANLRLRQKIEKELQSKGLNFLYQKLAKLDPEAAYIVDPKNPRRVIRALEIALSARKPSSATRRQGKPIFTFLQIGIKKPKEELRKRINKRVDAMIKEGLVNEVEDLIKKYPVNLTALEAIGYREIINHLQGKISLEEATVLMKKNTWKFAKRQLTWFRKDKNIQWVSSPAQAQKLTKAFLG